MPTSSVACAWDRQQAFLPQWHVQATGIPPAPDPPPPPGLQQVGLHTAHHVPEPEVPVLEHGLHAARAPASAPVSVRLRARMVLGGGQGRVVGQNGCGFTWNYKKVESLRSGSWNVNILFRAPTRMTENRLIHLVGWQKNNKRLVDLPEWQI